MLTYPVLLTAKSSSNPPVNMRAWIKKDLIVILNQYSVTHLIKQHQKPCVGFFGFNRRATLSISIIFKHDSRPHTSKKRLDVLALDCLAQHMPKMSQMRMCKSGVILSTKLICLPLLKGSWSQSFSLSLLCRIS